MKMSNFKQLPTDLSSNFSIVGENCDPNLWIDYIRRVPGHMLKDWHLVIWDWRFDPTTADDAVYSKFNWDSWHDFIRSRDNKVEDLFLLIANIYEAPNYHRHLSKLCDELVNMKHLDYDRIIHYSNNGSSENIPIKQVKTIAAMSIAAWKSEAPVIEESTHAFVFLNRRPRTLRVLSVVEMLKSDLLKHGYVSCGAYDIDTNPNWIENLVPDAFRDRFPMLLDGKIGQTDFRQYNIIDPRISSAAINVIGETSQDPMLELDQYEWIDPFLSEKTSKAFRLHQLPLWIAVQGTVAEARRLGFDVFDDVIDHSYDSEPNPHRRINMVLHQLRSFCNLGMDELNRLRRDLWPRLVVNKRRIDEQIYHPMDTMLAEFLECIPKR